jgi:hypothetical protein
MVRHPGSVSRRVGTLGVAALVAGAVLLGTGIAASAQTRLTAAAAPNKKKPTTTTTTTTVVTPSTTTQPCTPAPTTATGVNTTVTPNTTATVTMTPGTCIVSGTVVSLSGSGFQPTSDGTFLECNSDPNQPTVSFLGSAIPVSCTSPLETNQGPGVVTTTGGGDIGPYNFTVLEAASGVGPPCGSCLGTEATDSSGGSTVADAAKYPCPPTAAQMALSPPDTCGIIFGDEAGDGVTVPISFNLLVAPPATVPPTTTASPSATVATATKAATASTTNTSSSSLAFTGSGPGLWWLALVGLVLMAMGVLALALVDEPRRLVRLVVSRSGRSRDRAP